MRGSWVDGDHDNWWFNYTVGFQYCVKRAMCHPETQSVKQIKVLNFSTKSFRDEFLHFKSKTISPMTRTKKMYLVKYLTFVKGWLNICVWIRKKILKIFPNSWCLNYLHGLIKFQFAKYIKYINMIKRPFLCMDTMIPSSRKNLTNASSCPHSS